MVPVSRLDSALTLKDIFFGLVTERKQCIIMPSNWIKLLFLLFLTSIFFISQQLESIYSLAQWLFDMFFMSHILLFEKACSLHQSNNFWKLGGDVAEHSPNQMMSHLLWPWMVLEFGHLLLFLLGNGYFPRGFQGVIVWSTTFCTFKKLLFG